MKKLPQLSSGAVLTFALFLPPAVHAIGLTVDNGSVVRSEVVFETVAFTDESVASDPSFPQPTSVETHGSVAAADWSFENLLTGALFSAENIVTSVPGGDATSEIVADVDFDLTEEVSYSIFANIAAAGQNGQTIKLEVNLTGPEGILVEVNEQLSYFFGIPYNFSEIPGGPIAGTMPAGHYSLEMKFGVDAKGIAGSNALTGGFTVVLGDPGSDPTDPLIGGTPIEGFADWYTSEWFGDYNTTGAPWLFHAQHGFIYRDPGSTNASMFVYDDAMSAWWWTSDVIYPFLFVFNPPADNGGTDIGDEWLYYFEGTSGPRSFGVVTGAQAGAFLFFNP